MNDPDYYVLALAINNLGQRVMRIEEALKQTQPQQETEKTEDGNTRTNS